MSNVTPAEPTAASNSSTDRAFFLSAGIFALLLSSLPYLYGWLNTPEGSVYTGMTYNMDDTLVYLSWLRQVQEGSFFQRNLFAVEEQRGALINLWALLQGAVARFTGLPVIAVYHLARLGFGALLLIAVAWLIRAVLSERMARRWAFLLVCFGSGLGWLTGGYDPTLGFAQPIDLWQPEAVTFLSLYYAPLFTAALSLVVLFIGSAHRWEQTGKVTDALPAGIAGALLANFHTYDIIPLFVTWGVYRGVQDIRARQFGGKKWLGPVVAGLITLPIAAYQYWALISDPIFAARDVRTLTENPLWVVLGLGIPLVLAVVAITQRNDASIWNDPSAKPLLTVWAVTHLVCAYLPVDFQRKLLMGVQIPLCLLAGAALWHLSRRLSGKLPQIVAGLVFLLSVPSNLLFFVQDTVRLGENLSSTENRPYLSSAQAEALNWLRENAGPADIVFSSPDPASHLRFPFFALRPYLSMFVPAWTGARVYNGHGSETPKYGEKLTQTVRFFSADTPDAERQEFVRQNNIRYILYTNALAEGPPMTPTGEPLLLNGAPYQPVSWGSGDAPDWLKQKYQNTEITVYETQIR
ncbi:MAG: hypothetical protein OHK0029_30280 [Armatimonadaceae bacterium]